MAGKLAVAWATPVDAATLGAQLEAYAETKVTILSLRLCIRHAQTGSILGRLPIEMVENVATLIQQSVFEDHKGDWDQAVSCCLSDCAPIDHMDSVEYEIEFQKYRDGQEGHENCDAGHGRGGIRASFDTIMKYEVMEAHDKTVHTLLSKIGYHIVSKAETTFAKCRKVNRPLRLDGLFAKSLLQVFARDFGLETYFSVLRRYGEANDDYDPTRTIFGYLILPSRYSFMQVASGPLSVSFFSAMILDPLLLREPSPEERSRFKRAMIQLRLGPKVHPEQVTDTYSTSDAHLLTTEKRTWMYLEDEEYGALEHEDVEAASLEPIEWPKLMVLASAACKAEPDGS